MKNRINGNMPPGTFKAMKKVSKKIGIPYNTFITCAVQVALEDITGKKSLHDAINHIDDGSHLNKGSMIYFKVNNA